MHPQIPWLIPALLFTVTYTGCLGSQGSTAVSQPTIEDQVSPAYSNKGLAETSEISWIKSYEEGLKKAKQLNKPVLIYFWAVWCTFCAKMDREVLSDSEVINAVEKGFVPVLLDVDKEANLKYLSDYRVVGTPTFVILKPNGELVRGDVGYKTKEEFLSFLAG